MLNKKGFLLVESVILFETVVIIISMLSLLAFAIYGYEKREQDTSFKAESQSIREIYKHFIEEEEDEQ